MACLNLDLDYPDHPKTKRLVAILGPGAEILPIRLWCYAGKYHPATGRFSGYSEREIECLVHWSGEEGAFVAAMIRVGFLRKCEDGYELHEWKNHEGHLVMFKKRAKRAALARWQKYATSNPTSNASVNTQALHEKCPLPYHTLPNLTKHNHTLPNQEKDKRAFVRPTPDQVSEYAKSLCFSLDVSKFFDYYDSNGWRVGRNPMKDWKATVRNWRSNSNGQQAAHGRLDVKSEESQRLNALTEKIRLS